MDLYVLIGIGFLVLAVFTALIALLFRRIVATNEVHIVQSARSTTSYGKDTDHGNSYYQWPSWIPFIGITRIILPVSIFDLDLLAYEAYDKGRLPFLVDIKAFFRISDSNAAAQRVASFEELHNQLKAIVQGAVRTILASSEIEEIMQGRSTFGEQFTKEVKVQLSNWGVETVKNIELMDIRDGKESHVIRDIMQKRKSFIEMESRTEVAKNNRAAEISEIEASRDIEMQRQEAVQTTGVRTVETDRKVNIAKQQAYQEIKEQEKNTKEKEMDVFRVEQLRIAEITKDAKVIEAKQQKEISVIQAEAEKESTITLADGKLDASRKESEAVKIAGEAKASAEKEMQMAPVSAQIALAKEIGQNKEYQEYLIKVEQIRAAQSVGEKQAEALATADIKVISNAGQPAEGLTTVMDLFSANGGTKVGTMLEGIAQTDLGKQLVEKFVGKPETDTKH